MNDDNTVLGKTLAELPKTIHAQLS